jgi:SAM-dependent methyltransferase
MTSTPEHGIIKDHSDSFMDMVLRRMINEDFAEHPTDFNVEGLRAGQKFVEGGLTRDDLIVDIGGSSGQFAAIAAKQTTTEAHIVTIEPDDETYDYMPEELKGYTSFMQGYGEDIPLPDNSATGVTAHNVIFRVGNLARVLSEMKRVVRPGGFIAISTNAYGHAYYRHSFEHRVAEIMQQKVDIPFSIPGAPAEGRYIEDLPDIFRSAGELEQVRGLAVTQNTRALITSGRLSEYLLSIMYSVNRTSLPPEYRRVWREVVKSLVKPEVEHGIAQMEAEDQLLGVSREPFFADPIRRGMVVLRNIKPE